MSTGRRALPLVLIVLLAFGSLGLVLAKSWSPALGLDLQGGISIVYQATETTAEPVTSTTTTTLTPLTTTSTAPTGPTVSTDATSSTTASTSTSTTAPATTTTAEPEADVDLDQALDDAIEIIRSRVDSLGVAEPEILRQGDAIVVNLPGVADRERALALIGRTAELRFRPVLSVQPYITQEQLDATTTTAPGATTTTTTAPGGTTTTAPGTTTTLEEGGTTTTAGDEGAAGLVPGEYAAALPAQDTTTTTSTPAATTTAPGATTTTEPGTTTTTAPLPTGPDGEVDGCLLLGGTTRGEADTPDATVVLPGTDSRDDEDDVPELCYQLGPVPTDDSGSLVGSIVSGPEAQINAGEWGVSLDIKDDALPLFNTVATECYLGGPTCPAQTQEGRGSLAIVLDGEVQSAPAINEPTFGGEGLIISGSFTQQDAEDLALVLRYGALPIELEVQTVQTVSATLGEDSLRAGLIAGMIGVGLVFLYLFAYYRALGIVVVAGTAVWSALNYAVIAWLGETQGLALSLAGVTGIVISVGVTVDAYVVYFERLKDELRAGRTVRASIDRGFQRAFRTILAANVSSFIGAFLLYVLTVGPVRGFAFFLGLSTVLGVLVAWFFTRPLMALLGRSHLFTDHPILGVGRGLGVKEAGG